MLGTWWLGGITRSKAPPTWHPAPGLPRPILLLPPCSQPSPTPLLATPKNFTASLDIENSVTALFSPVALSLAAVIGFAFGCAAKADASQIPSSSESNRVTVAAYYYPCEHPDPHWDKNKYPGFTEWDLVRSAPPRFPGHAQPKVPLWGYTDESKPDVMAQKIAAAADHGVNVFIFDWYYYDTGP